MRLGLLSPLILPRKTRRTTRRKVCFSRYTVLPLVLPLLKEEVQLITQVSPSVCRLMCNTTARHVFRGVVVSVGERGVCLLRYLHTLLRAPQKLLKSSHRQIMRISDLKQNSSRRLVERYRVHIAAAASVCVVSMGAVSIWCSVLS